MTYRDPAPMHPDCPVCETAEHVVRHNNEYQGRWLCSGCMLLFDISDGLEAARAALREAAER
jgi:transposase-like protein